MTNDSQIWKDKLGDQVPEHLAKEIDLFEAQMQLRKLGRHWRSLSRTLSRTKQCMRSILLAANLRGPKFDGAVHETVAEAIPASIYFPG